MVREAETGVDVAQLYVLEQSATQVSHLRQDCRRLSRKSLKF